MESSSPDSHGQKGMAGSLRISAFVRRLRWGLPFLAALLPIVLLGLYALRITEQAVRSFVEAGNVSASMNVAEYLNQDFKRSIELVRAVASVPSTAAALRAHDDLALGVRLKAMVLAYPQIDRAFVTDRRGVLWADYPQAPDAFGRSQAESDWYLGISQRWKPYVSDVYIRSFDPDTPVFAVAMPIFDEAGGVLGALVTEHRTDQMLQWLENIRIGQSGYVFVVDQGGTVVAHPQMENNGRLQEEFSDVSLIRDARGSGSLLQGTYLDPLRGERMIASFLPLGVGQNRWVVVGGQPEAEAYRPLRRIVWNLGMAAAILTLFTFGMVVALAFSRRSIERLNAALESKNQTLRDITSFVSHQLRAPVTAMRWTIEGILDGDYGKVEGPLRQELATMADIATQNGQLINNILNVSRIDRGVIEVDLADIPLRDIAERALRDYKAAVEKAGLQLIVEGLEQNVLVHADKEKTAEAVTNSISNALKHTKQGSLTLRLRSDAAFGYIDVIDTGEGMPPEVIGRLFSRTGMTGKNADSSTSTGLGLFIARTFMQMQQGDITVSSQVGKGSTFTYSVPLAKEGSMKKGGSGGGH